MFTNKENNNLPYNSDNNTMDKSHELNWDNSARG